MTYIYLYFIFDLRRDKMSFKSFNWNIAWILRCFKLANQGPRSDFVIGGASEREARAFARGVRGDAPREILKFRPSAMAKNATKFVSCDKVCQIFI